MRYNDLFATILSGPAENDWSRAILWRQCIDLLAQYDGDDEVGGATASNLNRVVDMLDQLRAQLPTEQKLAVLRDLGRRLRSSRLVRLLLLEETAVQIATMNIAVLPDDQWPAIIATAGPLGRSILRQRNDLGPQSRRALDAFGLSDLSLIDLNANSRDELVLTADAVAPVADKDEDDGSSPIKRIVDRIERFTSERQDRVARDAELSEGSDDGADEGERETTVDPVTSFTFLTDADGVIQTAYEGPRAQLIGYRLATPSLDRSMGPDGQILGAFRRRGAFRDGRLTIGEGMLAGCWLVDGDPLFNHRTGRFTGYRGAARRAIDTDLAPQTGGTRDKDAAQRDHTVDHSTSLRQLIHELRSPLSGVMGFAELIETQMLGPVSDSYRSMAENIIGDVRALVDILDDLDLANRAVRSGAEIQPSLIGQLMRDAVDRLGRDAAGRTRFALTLDEHLPRVTVEATIAERMIAHFVRALAGCVGTETLDARCFTAADRVLVEIDRPAAMAGLSDEQLFDSGFEHVAVNMDAPVLGVGFALRLVRRLAQANGGALLVDTARFTLSLPVSASAAEQELSS